MQDDLRGRLFFTAEDVAAARKISLAAAHVLCSRYVRRGLFIRLKKNFYVLGRNWERYGVSEFFQISNFLQVPSYISFTSALSFYQITTQVQHGWYENAAQKRSKKIDGPGVCFVYFKIQPRLFFGYTRRNGCFLAEPEKALLDAAYLAWVGRYSLDWDALDVGRLDHGRLSEMAASFPEAIQQKVNARCRI